MKKFLISTFFIFFIFFGIACNNDPKSIVVNYDLGGHGENITLTYLENQSYTLPNPVFSGFEFDGWYYDYGVWNEEFTEIDFNGEKEITVYAKWNRIAYLVTFNTNGGSNINQTNTLETYQILTEPVTTRQGYNFLGWYDENGDKIEFPYSVDKKQTLTAHWQIDNNVLIEFYVDGALYHSITISKGSTLTLPQNPVKEGYVFEYWLLDGQVFDNDTKIYSPLRLDASFLIDDGCSILLANEIVLDNNNYIFNVDNQERTLQLDVRNNISKINLSNAFKLSQNTIFELYLGNVDGNLTGELTSKNLDLLEGENKAYIRLYNFSGQEKIYEVNIYRSKELTVYYYNLSRFSIYSQLIDEKFEVVDNPNLMIENVDDFKFIGWTTGVNQDLFEFGNKINDNLKLYAKYESENDYSHFNYEIDEFDNVSVKLKSDYTGNYVKIPSIYQIYIVNYIGERAFYGFSNLEIIDFNSQNIKRIGEYAFAETGISNIDLSYLDNETVPEGAFKNCKDLVSIILPNDMFIYDYAFYNCENLETNINCLYIYPYAFTNCKSLTDITIGRTVGEYAFSGCENLSSVGVHNEAYEFGIDYVAEYAFENCKLLIYIEFPKIKNIWDGVFNGCDKLVMVVIEDYDYISPNFTENVVVHIGKPETVGDVKYILDEENNTANILRYMGESSNIIIPESIQVGYSVYVVTGILQHSFKDTNLSEISLPSTITYIEKDCFINTPFYNDESNWQDNCLYIGNILVATRDAQEIIVKEGTKYIVEQAFEGFNVKTIILPESLVYVPVGILNGANQIENITIPFVGTNVNAEGEDNRFGNLFGYTDKFIDGENSPQFGQRCFYFPNSLETITVLGEVEITTYSLARIPGVTTINLENVIAIKSRAFSGSSSLTNLNLGNKCTTIESSCLEQTNVSKLLLETSVVNIKDPNSSYDIELTLFSKLDSEGEKNINLTHESNTRILYKDDWFFDDYGEPVKRKKLYYRLSNSNFISQTVKSEIINLPLGCSEILKEINFKLYYGEKTIVRAKFEFITQNESLSDYVMQLNENVSINIETNFSDFEWKYFEGYYYLVKQEDNSQIYLLNDSTNYIKLTNEISLDRSITQSQEYMSFADEISFNIVFETLRYDNEISVENALNLFN